MDTPPVTRLGFDLLVKAASQAHENEVKDNECPICLHSFDSSVGEPCERITVKVGSPCRVVTTQCGHRFHYGCLVEYICKTVVQAGTITFSPRKRLPLAPCPVCKQPLHAKYYLLNECLDVEPGDDESTKAMKYAQMIWSRGR